MSEKIVEFYRQKIKKSWKIAFVSTFITGLLVHIYKFTNTLPNHDSVMNYYADQNILGSGRWFLSIACGISSYFDLPWITGLFSIVFIALTAVVIVDLFNIDNPITITLTGAVLSVSPGITETLFFGFTADGYMVSMFLAALAVRLSAFEKKGIGWILVSSGLLCLSCGIYQSYISFAFLLMAFYFAFEMLENRHATKEAFRFIGKQIIIYIIGLVSYYIIWQMCMLIQGVSATDYQGIQELASVSTMSFDFGAWVQGIVRAVTSVVFYFIEWNIISNGITLYAVLNIVFILMLIIGIVIALIKSGILKRKSQFVLFLLSLAFCLPTSILWSFVSSDISYRPMMMVSLSLIFVFAIVLFERYTNNILQTTMISLLVIIIMNSALVANISYYYMNKAYEQTYAIGIDIISEVRDIDKEIDFESIAFVGERSDLVSDLTTKYPESNKIHRLAQVLRSDLFLNRPHAESILNELYAFEYSFTPEEKCIELEQSDEVIAMQSWPSREAFKVIDNVLVIKLGEIPPQ